MSEHQDRQFFRNFALTLVGLTLFGIFASIMGRSFSKLAETDGDAQLVENRVTPVGSLYTADNPAPKVVNGAAGATGAATATASADIGKSTYDGVCAACHGAGVAGAPKVGDKAVWEPRIAKGVETLHKHAIAGFQGEAGMMPAKGGRTDLSDDAVMAAVDYMLAESGGPARAAPAEAAAPAAEATAPAAPAAEAAPAAASAEAAAPAEAAAAPVAPAAEAAAPATADAGGKGKSTYDTVCAVCHGAGIAGAPKFGDKAAWEPRIAQGMDLLHEHAIKGFMGKAGMMPPKGGRADLPDDDVKAAVDYMVGTAK